MEESRTRWWDFPAALLLFLALLTSAARLNSTGWSTNLGPVGVLTAVGVILGMAFGVSRFRPWVVVLLASLYSIALIPWSFAALLYPRIDWLVRLNNLVERLGSSFALLFRQQPVEDTLLFSLLLAIFYWVISLVAGYALIRYANFMAAVIPAGIVMFVVQVYNSIPPVRMGYLVAYLFFALLLFGRLNYLRRRRYWKEHNFFQPYDASMNINGAIVITAVVMVTLLLVTPSPEKSITALQKIWARVSEPLNILLEDVGNIAAGLKGGAGAAEGSGFYGDILKLDQDAPKSDSLIFTIRVPGISGSSRYFWHVRAYDVYEDDQWSSSFLTTREFVPDGEELYAAGLESWNTAEFTFESTGRRISTLITPARTIWVDRPAEVTLASGGNENLEPIHFRVTPLLEIGESYQVRAVLSNPTVSQLRSAGSDYPDWVLENYLQLPADLPERIRTLAVELTEGEETPYDKVIAVTQYLRTTIEYNLTVPAPPIGRDVLEWFLFTHQEGFCSYYATAEVVLLRALGIPARMVVGFAQGEYRVPNTYLVRVDNAHAWPEVYFPDIGWVEFEPTAGQPQLIRPRGEPPTASFVQPGSMPQLDEEFPLEDETLDEPRNPVEERPTAPAAAQQDNTSTALIMLIISACAVLGVFIFVRYRSRINIPPFPVLVVKAINATAISPPRWLARWAYYAEQLPVVRSFESIFRSLRWLGEESPSTATPAQAAASLAHLIPEVEAEIQILLNEYQKTLYSQRHGAFHVTRRAAQAIRRAAYRGAARRMLSRLTGIFSARDKVK